MEQVLSGGGRPATIDELQPIKTMWQALSQLPMPTLQNRDNPHEYMFFSGGTSRQAIAQDLELYERMRQQQARQREKNHRESRERQ